MTLDPIAAQILIAIMINAPIWYLMRANFRKANTDAYESLSAALQTSGKTINDLFLMLAELPDLQNKLDEMETEMADLRLGVGILTSQLVENHIKPNWKPRAPSKKPEVKKKSSGFGMR
jgi:hypothetical protein